MKKSISLSVIFALFIMTGCATNPVTGRQELSLVSEQQEVQIGSQQYLPSRQMQGGDYILEPELTSYVNGVGQKLAAVSDRPLPYEFKVINNSTPNAWALPGGKMAVNRGLLTELNSEAELAAVLGHEMVHAAARHGAKAVERGMLMQGAVAVAGIAMSDSQYANLGLVGAQLGATLLNQKYSRDAERESDLYGMQYMKEAGYDPNAAVSLQEVFVRLSESRQQDWLSGLFSSHPPSMERVEANRQQAQELGAGGITGSDKYQQMTAHLRKTENGYKAHDEGRKALAEGNVSQALALAEKALKVEPREALFHGLRADARFEQGNYPDALTNYDRAIAANPEFFQFRIQRGLTKQKLNDPAGAKNDLEVSLKMLPTATAHKALGDIAYASGDLQAAKMHYETAAQSQDQSGKQALGALVRMDLPNNPNKYLQGKLALDRNNQPVLQIANPTPVGIRNIQYSVRYVDAVGRVQQSDLVYPGTIQPGTAATVPLGMGPVFSVEDLRNISVSVTSARISE